MATCVYCFTPRLAGYATCQAHVASHNTCIANGCSTLAATGLLVCQGHRNPGAWGQSIVSDRAQLAPAASPPATPTTIDPGECSNCREPLPHYSEPIPDTLVTLCRVFTLCPECYESPSTEHTLRCPDMLAQRGACTCCTGCFVVAGSTPGDHTCSELCDDSDDSAPCALCHERADSRGLCACPTADPRYSDSDACPTCPACGNDVAPPQSTTPGSLCWACTVLSDAYASGAPATVACTLPHCNCLAAR